MARISSAFFETSEIDVELQAATYYALGLRLAALIILLLPEFFGPNLS